MIVHHLITVNAVRIELLPFEYLVEYWSTRIPKVTNYICGLMQARTAGSPVQFVTQQWFEMKQNNACKKS